jgi:hypothetical protein
MCDYSLEYVASRAAAVADQLVSTGFSNTTTRGFAGVQDVNTAICLRPGTELAFGTPPVFEHPTTHQETIAPSQLATFRQINAGAAYTHHDALEFEDGTIVPLTLLLKGQYATVLQLPVEDQKPHTSDTTLQGTEVVLA